MIPDKLRIFIASIGLYALTIAVSLAAAWRHIVVPTLIGGVGQLDLTVQNALLFAAVFIVFTFVMVRFARVARVSLVLLLFVALIAGAQFVFSSWLSSPYDIVAAGALAVLLWLVPRVLVHDIAILIGIGGIAAVLGLSLTPLIACVLLATLAVYDIISVYRTRHMVMIAGRMLSSGAVFGFLVPARLSGFLMRRDVALCTRSVMMLGSGDIGLPLVLAVSALSQSVISALSVAVFSLAGIALMHWLFAHQRRPIPMAALPPIAVSAIIGYAVSLLL